MSKEVFITHSEIQLPEPVKIGDILPKILPRKYEVFASRLMKKLKKERKLTVLETDILPEKQIKKVDTPIGWAHRLKKKIQTAHAISFDEIGYFSVAYNVSSHQQKLPNIACQIANAIGLNRNVSPKQFTEYGCAGGLIAMEEAYHFCQQHDKPALVYIYDHCTVGADFNSVNDQNFKDMIKSYLLFSDAGSFVVLMNKACIKQYGISKMIRIKSILNTFEHADMLNLDQQGMHFENNTAQLLPQLVEDKLISQLKNEENFNILALENFCSHTGGLPILKSFQQYFKLSDKQMKYSYQTLAEFDNASAASLFITLHLMWRNIGSVKKDRFECESLAIAFGSGIYMGGMVLNHN
ncbi:hypothetical protein GCM10027429_07750 [Marivirga atlantica]|jgi:predicted naringenin-chalcone synthase|uniref:Chalcone/stilbene synthase C-terminal domain-containing protein n=1 Tax=Marivirga atlantica TaxID=1548457 RepID=A0A937A8V9_9BACT|nr:hypothetical protein [Marivirga atlantica]MBL0764385.1 hypothetical protein [Marivirga atlantica]